MRWWTSRAAGAAGDTPPAGRGGDLFEHDDVAVSVEAEEEREPFAAEDRRPAWLERAAAAPHEQRIAVGVNQGEIHRGRQYRLVESREGIFQASEPRTRAVQPVPTQSLRTFGASGTAITNNPRVDWGLVTGGFLGKSLLVGVSSVNGDSSSMPPAIFSYVCRGSGKVVTCRHEVGDFMRYTRGPKD